MRTNIDIDEELLRQAFAVSSARTKKQLVHEALAELVKRRRRKDLTEIAGEVNFYEGYDHKESRRTRG